jgi:DNA-binding GntR family transcriptional regulator
VTDHIRGDEARARGQRRGTSATGSTFNEETYEKLRTQIINGSLKPGSRLMQAEIAKALGLSRVPLREAIRRLEGERLIVAVPRRGVTVPDLTDENINDLYSIRLMLEPLAAGQSATAITQLQVLELKAATAELASLLDDPSEYFRTDDLLVRDMLSIGVDEILLDTITIVRNRGAYLRYAYMVDGGLIDGMYERRKVMVAAVCSGRAELAEAVTRVNLIQRRDALLDWCASRPNGSGQIEAR